ncbi:hypothetical protein PF003_g35795 [Phytophthora fragariae]|nr:hypothetical protein PF003_g35795 [Phytophthora fragariae]
MNLVDGRGVTNAESLVGGSGVIATLGGVGATNMTVLVSGRGAMHVVRRRTLARIRSRSLATFLSPVAGVASLVVFVRAGDRGGVSRSTGEEVVGLAHAHAAGRGGVVLQYENERARSAVSAGLPDGRILTTRHAGFNPGRTGRTVP